MNDFDLSKIETPAYIFSKSELVETYKDICSKMEGVQVYYSLKANAEIPIIECLSNVGAKFEVASDGEFERVLEAGVNPQDIICGLPVKKETTIKTLYQNGCTYFVFDMMPELYKILRYAPDSQKILRIYINDIIPNSLEFGMTFQEIETNIMSGTLSTNNINGISFHISNNINTENFNRVWDRALQVIELFQFLDNQSFILNIGGGYRNYASAAFFDNLTKKIIAIHEKYPKLSIIAEPGNTIVNEAGVLLSKVIGIKKRNGFFDVYMDAGKPTGLKTDNKRLPTYIKVINKSSVDIPYTYRFVDLTCMHRPHFTYELPYKIEPNDILEFGGMGAYTVCLQSMFHVWASPKIYIFEGAIHNGEI